MRQGVGEGQEVAGPVPTVCLEHSVTGRILRLQSRLRGRRVR